MDDVTEQNDDLRERAIIEIGSKRVILEPYSRSVYKLEVDGKVVAEYHAARPPIVEAMNYLNKSSDFNAAEISAAMKNPGWTSVDVDLGPKED
ncbi:hypothetical protein [uncultured Roseobacter sp.]|uniref:hypothetical protein n=1 Tax=uncultured Roseobacter sp. TaxID=114847 RepID=UPI002619761A|nr:hypothetical protein [uncultured Roseobacter sp.]